MSDFNAEVVEVLRTELRSGFAQLSGDMNRGFSVLSSDIRTMDRGLQNMNRNLENMDRKLENMDRKLENMDRKLQNLETSVKSLKSAMNKNSAGTGRYLISIDDSIGRLEKRLDKIEDKH